MCPRGPSGFKRGKAATPQLGNILNKQFRNMASIMDMDVDQEAWAFCDGPAIPSDLLEGVPSSPNATTEDRRPLGDITREVWRALAASGVFSKDKAGQEKAPAQAAAKSCHSLQLPSSSPITSPASKRQCSLGAFMQNDGPQPHGLPPRSPAPSKLQSMTSLRAQPSPRPLLAPLLPQHSSPTHHSSPAKLLPSLAMDAENSYAPQSPTQTRQNSPARACLHAGSASSPIPGGAPGSPLHALLTGSPAGNTVRRGLIFR